MADGNPKKDLTGIFDLPQADPILSPGSEPGADPFSSETAIEKIDDFESIDQIGMMDHVPEPESTPEPETSGFADSFPSVSEPEIAPSEASAELFENNFTDTPIEEAPPIVSESNFAEPIFTELPPPEPSSDFLSEIKTYSEQAKQVRHEGSIHYPFHLLIQGEFGPFERDKLLLFITENQIGISSSQLDLQLQAGRTLFPRISEYAGIKIIQELRDSGLQFSLTPSSRDDDETTLPQAVQNFHFESSPSTKTKSALIEIPVLPLSHELFNIYLEFDSIQVSQFLKAEMVEAEQSELFQEIVDRLLENLKQQARRLGGHALTRLERKTIPLRLPSQYQITIEASVLRKK